MSQLLLSKERVVKALKISASVAAVPILTVVGVVLLMLAWLLFFLKTSPQAPLNLDLIFAPTSDGKCITSLLPNLPFPLNSRVRLEMALTWPDRPDLAINPGRSHVLRADCGVERTVYFNFLPTYRSPLVRHVRTLLKLPLCFLLGKREEESQRFRTTFLQVKPTEAPAFVEICPALPLYHSSLTVVFEPKGFSKFIHHWPVFWTLAFLLSTTALSIVLGIVLSIAPWFFFRNTFVDPEAENKEPSDEENIGLDDFFDQDRNVSHHLDGSNLVRKRNILHF